MTRGEALSTLAEVAVDRLNQCRHEFGAFDVEDDLIRVKAALEKLGCFVSVDGHGVVKIVAFGEEFE